MFSLWQNGMQKINVWRSMLTGSILYNLNYYLIILFFFYEWGCERISTPVRRVTIMFVPFLYMPTNVGYGRMTALGR